MRLEASCCKVTHLSIVSTIENDVTRSAVADSLWQARYLIYLVVLAWIVSILNFGLLGRTLNRWGVRPRSLRGLVGIFVALFLHGAGDT